MEIYYSKLGELLTDGNTGAPGSSNATLDHGAPYAASVSEHHWGIAKAHRLLHRPLTVINRSPVELLSMRGGVISPQQHLYRDSDCDGSFCITFSHSQLLQRALRGGLVPLLAPSERLVSSARVPAHLHAMSLDNSLTGRLALITGASGG